MIKNTPFNLLTNASDRIPLSPNPERRWVIWVLTVIFLGFFFGYLNYALQPNQADNPGRWLIVGFLGLVSTAILYTALFRTSRPSTPLVYDAPRVWRRRRRHLRLGAAVPLTGFCLVIVSIISEQGFAAKDLPLMFTILVLSGLFYWYFDRYFTRQLRKTGPFGLSRIDVAGGLPARLGDTVAVTLHCVNLPGTTERITATLRNVREYWKPRKDKLGKKRRPVHKTEFITEHRQRLPVTGAAVNFNVTIAPAGRLTEYTLTEPIYWELEVRDDATGYYARFFLEVV